MRAAAILLLAALMAAGCSQPQEAPEEPEKAKRAPEETTVEETTAQTKETTVLTEEPTDPYAEADAQKAAAVGQEMTVEDFRGMDERNRLLLLECQLQKYEAENGPGAADAYADEKVDEMEASPDAEVVPLQEDLIKDGYSCTFQEMVAAGAAASSASANASASASQ